MCWWIISQIYRLTGSIRLTGFQFLSIRLFGSFIFSPLLLINVYGNPTMLIASWRSFSSLKIYSILELSSSPKTHFVLFHSTSVLSENSCKKFGSSGKVSKFQRASKNSIRYTCTVKEKRSDAKKALHNLLFHTKGSRDFLQNEWHFGEPNREIRDRNVKKKSSPGRGKQKDGTEMEVLTMSLIPRLHSLTVNPNLIRLIHIRKTQHRVLNGDKALAGPTNLKEARIGMMKSSCDEEPLIVKSRSQRTVLGLPTFGPLKISDVKNAFRSAALKWHPDKHQGPSQEAAQEKFKLCLDAYKSLCSSLS